MKINLNKLSKRTRLILAVLLIAAIVAWSLWGPDAVPAADADVLPAQSSTVESLPELTESQVSGGAATDESSITGTPPDSAVPDTLPEESEPEESAQAESEPAESEPEESELTESGPEEDPTGLPDEDGSYTSKEDVARYLHVYGRLPKNFMTKAEARDLGWDGGSLEPYAEGMCIGGDRFGNYEGLLPEKEGRRYTECDIDTLGKSSRGAKRIVFSNDGLIYYTDDHYESFELLYGEEDA